MADATSSRITLFSISVKQCSHSADCEYFDDPVPGVPLFAFPDSGSRHAA